MGDTLQRELQLQRRVTWGTRHRAITLAADQLEDTNHVRSSCPWTHITLGGAALAISAGATATRAWRSSLIGISAADSGIECRIPSYRAQSVIFCAAFLGAKTFPSASMTPCAQSLLRITWFFSTFLLTTTGFPLFPFSYLNWRRNSCLFAFSNSSSYLTSSISALLLFFFDVPFSRCAPLPFEANHMSMFKRPYMRSCCTCGRLLRTQVSSLWSGSV